MADLIVSSHPIVVRLALIRLGRGGHASGDRAAEASELSASIAVYALEGDGELASGPATVAQPR